MLSCLRDPLGVMERYVSSLNPGGLVLVSMCTAARGSADLMSRIQRAYASVDQVRVTHCTRKVTWICSALIPEDLRPSSRR